MNFWNKKIVLVAGGAGFIGSHLVEKLCAKGASVVVADRDSQIARRNLSFVIDKIRFLDTDLLELDNCVRITSGVDIVMNLAGKVAGIEYNQRHKDEMFFNNVRISANLLEASRVNNVKRFLVVSSACVYPRHCLIPTPETEGFRHIPEPTNEGYGWAKRMAEAQGMFYAKEFGMEIAIARPYNAYGPRDCFDLERAHVIPALIRRVLSGENPLVVWGSGEQSRAFLYVEDFAEALMEITEKYAVGDPVNIGVQEEIKIKDLVKMIVELCGKKIDIIFDTSKLTGQPRRNCDNTKLKEKVGYLPSTPLKEGLRRTIEWYKMTYLFNE